MTGDIELHGGDFGTVPCRCDGKRIVFLLRPARSFLPGSSKTAIYRVDDDLAALNSVTQEDVKRLAGAVGWGFVGAFVSGPIGALAGVLAGGRGTRVTFACMFRDGKRFLGTTDVKTFQRLQGAAFSRGLPASIPSGNVPPPLQPQARPAAPPKRTTPIKSGCLLMVGAALLLVAIANLMEQGGKRSQPTSRPAPTQNAEAKPPT